MNEFCVDYLTWYPWSNVTLNEYMDLLELIEAGGFASITYEVRELVVSTINNKSVLYNRR